MYLFHFLLQTAETQCSAYIS